MTTKKTPVSAISKGIQEIDALYAAFLGKKEDHKEVDADAKKKIDEAQKKFEAVRESELKRVAASQAEVEQAKADVQTAQNKLRESTGAVVNVLEPASGGRTNL